MRDRLIELFNTERDKQYSIPIKDIADGNSCSGKHIRLKRELEKLGVKVRYRVCEFSWGDLNIPEEILPLAGDEPATHVYLEVSLNGIWVNLDASWDKGLDRVFPVNEWDGITSTTIAVKPTNLYSHKKSEEIMTMVKKLSPTYIEKDTQFIQAFNNWISSLRK